MFVDGVDGIRGRCRSLGCAALCQVIIKSVLGIGIERLDGHLCIGQRIGSKLNPIVGSLVLDPYKWRSTFEDTGATTQLPGSVACDIPVKTNAGRYDQEAIWSLAYIVGGAV